MQYKKMSEESERMLEKAFNILSEISVNGQNVFRMATVLGIIQEIVKQINAHPEEGEEKKEE